MKLQRCAPLVLALLTVVFFVTTTIPVAHASGSAESLSRDAARDTTRTITDGLGREVTIPADPQRIVTAGRAVMMTANALWAFETAPERVIGVGRISQGRGNFLREIDPGYDERITVLERTAGAEQVASLAPDLVILKSVVRENLGVPLERLGLPVVYVDLETPEQYQRDLGVLGAVLQEEDRARDLQQYFRETSERIQRTTDELAPEDRPSALLIYYRGSGGDVAFTVPPAGWIQTRLVETAGGDPVWRDANPGGGWGTVSFEQIAVWDPEVIVLVEYGGAARDLREHLQTEPRWQALRAVRENRFHAMPMDYYSWDQPDVRWILGLQWLAATLQPERFTDLRLDEQARAFFERLYRFDNEAYDRLIAPVLAGDFPGDAP